MKIYERIMFSAVVVLMNICLFVALNDWAGKIGSHAEISSLGIFYKNAFILLGLDGMATALFLHLLARKSA